MSSELQGRLGNWTEEIRRLQAVSPERNTEATYQNG